MGECPFCGSKVHVDLITFGGPCPKCFADIPGEEAATDPGEDVKAAQALKDQRRSTMKTLLPLVFALPLIGMLALAALWFGVLRPAPEVVLLDFDDLDEYPMPELVAAAPDTDDGASDASAELRPVQRAPKEAPAPQAQAKVEPGLDLSLDVSAERRGATLDDAEAIKRMIGQQMSAQAPRLNACYEKQLKNNENLAGRWRVGFVVAPTGKVQDPAAEALSGSVPEFERCLVEEVAKWSFQRIAREQAVRKTFTFRPAP